MSLTYTLDSPPVDYIGANRVVRGTITFDDNYPTGGEAVSNASLGLTRLIDLVCDGDDGIVITWNRSETAPKLIAYWVDTTTDGAAMAEVVDTTSLASVVTRFVATGK